MAAEITKEDLKQLKDELVSEIISIVNHKREGHQEWLKSSDVQKMLRISTGTLQTFRINGTLPFTKVGGTIYYSYSDVLKILNQNKKEITK